VKNDRKLVLRVFVAPIPFIKDINMGFRFRKSMKSGPFRLNASKKGVGASWGFPGFLVGISLDCRRYFSIGFPGIGLYFMKYLEGQ
jgi:hypothetical protein